MKKPIHVLYISYDGMTDPLGQSQVLPYLLGLEKLGYSFTLLSAEKKDAYQKNKDTINNLIEDRNINWEPIIYSKNPPIFSTIYDYVVLKNKSIALYKKNKYQLVHCRSYISALVGVFLKRKIQTPFIFDMRGFWADERIDGNIWNLKNPVHQLVYKFFKFKEKDFLKLADAVICLTEKAKDEISNWKCLYNNSSKITVIPCCVDISFFNPNNINSELSLKKRQVLGLKNDDLVLGYVGSIGTWYLLSEMLDFFKVLKTYRKEAKFLFITQESHVNILLPAHEKGLNKEDLFIISGKRQEMPELISLMDFGIFFIKPVYSKMASSPTKQGEMMAMGKAIVCNEGIGDTDMIINKFNAGIVVKNYDYKSVIELLQTSKFDSNNIRQGAEDYFSLEDGIRKYQSVYEKLAFK